MQSEALENLQMRKTRHSSEQNSLSAFDVENDPQDTNPLEQILFIQLKFSVSFRFR